MTSKETLVLALRVLGFWVLISAVGNMAALVAMFAQGPGPSWGLVSVGIAVLAYSSLAAFFLLYAPWIASWFNGREMDIRSNSSITVGDIYQISTRLLGLYSLLSAIPSASKVLIELIAP